MAVTKDKDWERRDRVIRGLPPVQSETPIKDQPTEDGGPVRGPEDEPFKRDPELVEADMNMGPEPEKKS